MTDRSLARLARVVFTIIAILFATAIVLSIIVAPHMKTASWGSPGLLPELLFLLTMMGFPIVGVLIATRRPRNAIGWVLLGIGVVWGIDAALTNSVAYGLLLYPGSVPGAEVAAALSGFTWVPGIGLIGTYLLLLFPDGRLPSPRWKKVARAIPVAMIVSSIVITLIPGDLADNGFPGIENPLGVESLRSVVEVLQVTILSIPILILVCAGSLVLRFRRSRGEERLQLKWLAGAATVVALLYLSTMIAGFATGDPAGSGAPTWLQTIQLASLLSMVLIPIAIGIALLRYRLYDIDLVINRTLVYGSLTAVLAAAYIGLVVAFQAVLAPVTAESDLAIAASTLAVAAMFRPARTRVQGFIDRRFYRRKFDTQRTVEEFTAHLRDEVDLGALSRRLMSVVADTMQPAHISLWVPENHQAEPVTLSER
jgi:hypothetical protein